jgi:hypothetical protein
MPREIIILEQVGETGDFRVAFWLDVPAARRAFYADPAATSQFLNATAEEIAALRSGAVVERVERIDRPFGGTLAQLRTTLTARHAALQARVNAENPWARYGTSFDGTTWTVAGVA